jgi:hypothetical protein
VKPLTQSVCMALSITALALPARATAQARDTMRVLFIGNSFTYYHNMPRLVEAIAANQPGPVIRATMVAIGGATLQMHWNDTTTRRTIRGGPWDWVVFNEHSAFGEAYLVDGHFRIHGSSGFADYASRFATEARAVHAQPAFIGHWADREAPARDQQALDSSFIAITRGLHATLIPASLGWRAIRSTHPEIELYDPDHHHPSEAGSYLLASLVYATLTHRIPAGSADTIIGPQIEESPDHVQPGPPTTLVSLPRSQANALAAAAWSVHERVERTGGYPSPLPQPGPIEPPTLPPGNASLTAAGLVGTWTGTTDLYPTPSPVQLTLRVELQGDSLTGTVRSVVLDRTREGPVSVSVHKNVLTLVGAGPNHGSVQYRGVLRDGALVGIDEFSVPDSSMRGIGTWRLTRAQSQ